MKTIKGLLRSAQILLVLTLLFSFSAYADQQLFQAVRGGNLTKIKTLLGGAGERLPSIDVNMNINAQDSQGKTALHWAVSDAHMSSDVAKVLLQSGADPNITDNRGWTPVHWALNYNRDDLVLLLGEFGADMDVAYEDGHTPLHHAWSNLELTKLLIKAGANVNATDTHGWTALHYAFLNGKHAVVDELISAGADVNVTDSNGWTLFHLTFLYGHYLTADGVVKAGANVDARDPNGNTLLHLAILYGDEDFFMDNYHNYMVHAIEPNPEEIQMFLVWEIIRHGADVNALDSQGYAPLSTALWMGKLEVAQLLIDSGVNVNAKDPNGIAPLYIASYYGYEDLVNSLIEAGVEVGNSDIHGTTSLHWAGAFGYPVITNSLLQFGADAFAKNALERTPLKEAKLQRKAQKSAEKSGIIGCPAGPPHTPSGEYSEVIKLLRKNMGLKRFNPFMKNKK